MSRTGLGYEISFAYNNFDNKVMYPLILLILAVSVVVNATLSHWEQLLMRRRSRA
jgi:NitT/TauT family transport system permease protein